MKESGWLIEHNGPNGTRYLFVDGGFFGWTKDSTKALRLARRVDADMLAEIIDEDAHRIAEHQWG